MKKIVSLFTLAAAVLGISVGTGLAASNPAHAGGLFSSVKKIP